MSDDIKLKACPMCGGPAKLVRELNCDAIDVAHVKGCLIYGLGGQDWHFDGQIGPVGKDPASLPICVAWNNRATSCLTKRLAEALREVICMVEYGSTSPAIDLLKEYDASTATGEDGK